jgi:hypothetical protein
LVIENDWLSRNYPWALWLLANSMTIPCAKKLQPRNSWKMLDTGWVQKTNGNAAFSGKTYSKCVKLAL